MYLAQIQGCDSHFEDYTCDKIIKWYTVPVTKLMSLPFIYMMTMILFVKLPIIFPYNCYYKQCKYMHL